MPDAAFAFDARVALIRRAERSLDMQYYLLRTDSVGLLMLNELRNAAARGVRVRLLVDDLYAGGEDELFFALSAFPNIEVRHFNPLPSRARFLPMRLALSLFDLLRINHRMHNKLLVADNSFAVSGGRNVGNEYFMRDIAANFIDIDVLSSGPIVRDMSASFDSFWNSAQVRAIGDLVSSKPSADISMKSFDSRAEGAAYEPELDSRDSLGRLPVSQQMENGLLSRTWAPARLYADTPNKLSMQHDVAYLGSVSEGAFDAIASSRREVKILSPYFVPGPQGMAVLQQFVANGGRVLIVTNSLGSTDEPLAYAGYERYRADLLKIGVTVYEIAPEGAARTRRFGDFGTSISRLHAKVAVLDDDRIFIGSMNLDHRSASINTELGLVIESSELVKEFNELLAADHIELGYRLQLTPDGRRAQWIGHGDQGEYVVYEDVPGSFLWQRLKNWLLLPLLGVIVLFVRIDTVSLRSLIWRGLSDRRPTRRMSNSARPRAAL